MTDRNRLKRVVDRFGRTLNVLETLVSTLDIPPNVKESLLNVVKNLSDGVADIVEIDPELSTPDAVVPIHQIGDSDIHFKEVSVYPATQEVSVGGVKKYVPKKEFTIMYTLVANANQPVQFDNTTSLQTHLSGLRRLFPRLKQLIFTQGKGKYCITLTKQ